MPRTSTNMCPLNPNSNHRNQGTSNEHYFYSQERETFVSIESVKTHEPVVLETVWIIGSRSKRKEACGSRAAKQVHHKKVTNGGRVASPRGPRRTSSCDDGRGGGDTIGRKIRSREGCQEDTSPTKSRCRCDRTANTCDDFFATVSRTRGCDVQKIVEERRPRGDIQLDERWRVVPLAEGE